jgi:hypothetical protein
MPPTFVLSQDQTLHRVFCQSRLLGIHERKKLDVRRLGIDSLKSSRNVNVSRWMSDAKLASTHPRKARNTQLVKDPENDLASSIRGFRPAVWFARFLQAVAVSGDKAMIPRPPRVSSFGQRKLEKVLSPPGWDVGWGQRGGRV